jgi:hAT family C-terminal dimerisation region
MSTSESDHVHLSFEGIDLSHSSEMDRTSFLELSEMYLDSLIENLEVRLCNNSTRVLDAFCILEPRIAVTLSVEERAKYYDILDSHFKVTKDAVEAAYVFVDVPLLKKELVRLTALFSGCYSGLRFDGFARMLLLRHRDDFPQACRLAELGLSLPVSTASCERGFSLQNRIKIKSRTRLLPENLERLMKLAAGPQIESFPVAEAVYHWYRSRRRRLARLYQASRSTATARDVQAIAEFAYENCEEEMVGLDDAYYDVCV